MSYIRLLLKCIYSVTGRYSVGKSTSLAPMMIQIWIQSNHVKSWISYGCFHTQHWRVETVESLEFTAQPSPDQNVIFSSVRAYLKVIRQSVIKEDLKSFSNLHMYTSGCTHATPHMDTLTHTSLINWKIMQYSSSSGLECGLGFCFPCRLTGEINATGSQTSKTLANNSCKAMVHMEWKLPEWSLPYQGVALDKITETPQVSTSLSLK